MRVPRDAVATPEQLARAEKYYLDFCRIHGYEPFESFVIEPSDFWDPGHFPLFHPAHPGRHQVAILIDLGVFPQLDV